MLKRASRPGLIARGLAVSGAVVAALTLSVPAFAATVTIGDLGETGLTRSVSGIDILGGTEIVTAESWSFTGNLHIPIGLGVLTGTHLFVLREPLTGLTGPVSDFFMVVAQGCPDGGNPNIGACTEGPEDFLQQVTVAFFSDAEGPLALPSGTIDCNAEETGLLQSCGFRGPGGSVMLTANVTSDTSDIPEPASITLVGLGLALAGLGCLRRRAKA